MRGSGGRASALVARLLPIVAATLIGAVFLRPGPVAGFELSGCTLIVQSFDADGQPLDTVIGDPGGGDGGTQEDPLLVDYHGTVRWQGDSGETPITDFDWNVDIFLIPTPIRGHETNEEETTATDGEIDVSASLPLRVSGLAYVSGQLSGEGGACRGGAWVRILEGDTPPPATPPFWLALLLMLAGAVVLWAARPSLVLPGPYREVR